MDRRKLSLRREALADLTEHDLRSAAGGQQWSADAMTCPANTCDRLTQVIRSLFHTICECPTD